MKKSNLLLILLTALFLVQCKKEPKEAKVDLKHGLVVEIAFNGNAKENILGVEGKVYRAIPVEDRKGNVGHAMQFNRLDSAIIQYDNLKSASFPNNIFSISFWVQIPDTNYIMAVLSKRSRFSPYEYSIDNHFGKSHLTFDNWVENGTTTIYGIDPLQAKALIKPNTWQHIVYVADGEKLLVYLDGILQQGVDFRNQKNNFTTTQEPLVIGNGGAYNKNHYFNGSIDDIRMYNKVLNQKEVEALFNL
jgi:hypothetical protein